MAQASGIVLIKDPFLLDPLRASTFGTGQLIKKAVKHGFRKILLAIGGSATVDGGMGALSALGVKFYDKGGSIIREFGNKAAGIIHSIDFSQMQNILHGIDVSIACDVENPLLGINGSSVVYGPQKSSPKLSKNELNDLLFLMDQNLNNFNEAIIRSTGHDYSNLKGSGAAGGFPIGFCAFADAKLVKGADLVLNWIHFDEIKADQVFTCEGFCDRSTLMGKASFAVCQSKKDSYVSVLTGGIESIEVEKKLFRAGAKSISVLADRPMTLEESLRNATKLLERSAFRENYSFLQLLQFMDTLKDSLNDPYGKVKNSLREKSLDKKLP
jgi:glycerate kinase